MPNNKTLTPTQAMEAIQRFGQRNYKRGYRQACLEMFVSLGGLALTCFGINKYVDWRFSKYESESENEKISEEEAE